MMGSAWGHRIAKLTGVPDPIPPAPEKPWWSHVCSVSKCTEAIEFAVEWDGTRGGRHREVQRLYCKAHAEQFCKNQDIDIAADAFELTWDRAGTLDLSRMYYDRSRK